MKITVKDFMGCQTAEIDATKLALVIGQNHQGKSSLCRAAGAVLSGDTVPLGLRKTDAGMLVRSGGAKSIATAETETGKATVAWPKADRKTEGTPPYASPHAVGIASIVDMPAKDVVDTLTDLLNASPTREDLATALAEIPVNPKLDPEGQAADREKVIQKIWESIERDGWDLTHKQAGEKGRVLKGQWEYATSEKYGAKKADSWVPNGWDENLSGTSEESLDARVTNARAELEDAISRRAVSDDEMERLQAAAAPLDELKASLSSHQDEMDRAREKLDKLLAEKRALPTPEQETEGLPCPHCSKPVVIVAGRQLEIPKPFDKTEMDARARAIELADAAIQEETPAMNSLQSAVIDANRLLNIAKDAKAKLDEIAAQPASAAVDVDGCRTEVRRAESDLAAFKVKADADRLHRNVIANQAIIDALAQTGVRQSVLSRALDQFNERLTEISKQSGWAAVSIGSDMRTEFGGRPYVLLSASEQFRVRVTVQVAVAEYDKSEVLVIDAAEVLDGRGRSGLLAMLHKRQHKAIIGMMLPSPDKAPDLAAMSAGSVYWIDNGICADVRKSEA